jgi:hypothetical protein
LYEPKKSKVRVDSDSFDVFKRFKNWFLSHIFFPVKKGFYDISAGQVCVYKMNLCLFVLSRIWQTGIPYYLYKRNLVFN